MKIYLAGSWARRDEIREYAEELKNIGIEITSRWLYEHGKTPEYQAALEDLEDIRQADILVLFTQSNTDSCYTTGGRHFETGYAWAKGIEIIIVGPTENIFHSLIADTFNSFSEFKKRFLSYVEG